MPAHIRCDAAPGSRDLAAAVVEWQKQHGRHALPWQGTRDAYRIWLSEIMLQQTQVAAVIPYYQRFIARFPDVRSLAEAPAEEVMAQWSGLGYYSRARNLHRCAQIICADHGGIFPADPNLLAELPGIGRSTAAAISAFAYGTRAAILDGNVKRVFCRLFGVQGYPGERKVELALWQHAEALLPQQGIEAYTQGLMDLGATVCTRSRPSCARCPLSADCVAFGQGLTDSLPVRKPKKMLPTRQALMIVVVDGEDVLLEERPNFGIWGGLLSLPQLDDAENNFDTRDSVETAGRISAMASRFGEVASWQALQDRSHVFTHFRLDMSLYLVRIAARRQMVAEAGHRWYPKAKLAEARHLARRLRLLRNTRTNILQELI